jgi:hypothetical protein
VTLTVFYYVVGSTCGVRRGRGRELFAVPCAPDAARMGAVGSGVNVSMSVVYSIVLYEVCVGGAEGEGKGPARAWWEGLEGYAHVVGFTRFGGYTFWGQVSEGFLEGCGVE